MRLSVYVPLVVCGIVAAASPRLVKGWRPAWAARTLALIALLVSLAYVWGLLLLAGILLGQAPALSEPGDYSRMVLGRLDPVPELASVTAIAILVLVAWRLGSFITATVKRGRMLRRVFPAGSREAELQVLADMQPFAAAIGPRFGRPGRIVVSVGMLQHLDAAERRVLLAHERAHLRRRHHLYEGVGRLAVTVNPMLGGLRHALRFVLERWADEEAAASVADRALVARAIGRAAMASMDAHHKPSGIAAAGLGLERFGVAERIHALSAEPVTARRLPVMALSAVIALIAVIAASDATLGFLRLLVWARAAH